MANAPVLKTGGRKPLGVRVPRSPQRKPYIVYVLYSPAHQNTHIDQTHNFY